MNILIAEDSTALSDILVETLLEDDRVSAVALADDGRSALTAITSPDREADGIRFDAVLTDWDLGPGPDGLSIAFAARKAGVPENKVILWSAIDRTGDIAHDPRDLPSGVLLRTKDDIKAILEELLS